MMQPSPWADYVDARVRLVRQWADEGHDARSIAVRLTVTPKQVEELAACESNPPVPGCSRHIAELWRDRTEKLEAEFLRASSLPPPNFPLHSDVRELWPEHE